MTVRLQPLGDTSAAACDGDACIVPVAPAGASQEPALPEAATQDR